MTRSSFFICLLSLGCLTAFAATTADAQSTPETKPRAALFDPKSIELLNAVEFRAVLAHHRGSVILVNLWATWCVPCLKELPEFVELQQQYGSQGLKVIPVSMDDPAEIESAKKLLQARGPGLRGYLQTEREQETFVSVIDPAWAGIMPTTFVLDREGKLKATLTGGKKFEDFEAAIAPLLK
jgi:thiol-disulfide isomerase/thioredoxin